MIIIPSIIIMALDGQDREYMEWLYTQHHCLMLSTAWRYFKEPSIVDDIVSDSCIALMKNLHTLRGLERNKLRVYIVSTVRNTALNYYTKQKAVNNYVVNADKEVVDSVADDADFERKIALKSELAMVWAAISRLPEKEQLIMQLKFSQGLSNESIAENVDLSPSSIAKYISRARDRIKDMIYAD